MIDLVDSHCHLDLLQSKGEGEPLRLVLEEARAQGVSAMLSVAVNPASWTAAREYAQRYSGVFASAGVHPNEPGPEPDIEELARAAAEPNIVAVGETGLDYYRCTGELEWQRERFRRHIAVARDARKPLIIHSREAKEDTLRILREEAAAEVGGVMHCFVEDWDAARRAMDLGFYVSFSGIVTFRNAGSLKEVAMRVPLDRLLVETDSPYLAPVPHRGRINRPAYVRHVAAHIAELRGAPLERIAEATTRNFYALFERARKPAHVGDA